MERKFLSSPSTLFSCGRGSFVLSMSSASLARRRRISFFLCTYLLAQKRGEARRQDALSCGRQGTPYPATFAQTDCLVVLPTERRASLPSMNATRAPVALDTDAHRRMTISDLGTLEHALGSSPHDHGFALDKHEARRAVGGSRVRAACARRRNVFVKQVLTKRKRLLARIENGSLRAAFISVAGLPPPWWRRDRSLVDMGHLCHLTGHVITFPRHHLQASPSSYQSPPERPRRCVSASPCRHRHSFPL